MIKLLQFIIFVYNFDNFKLIINILKSNYDRKG